MLIDQGAAAPVRVSAVVATYNRAPLLRGTLEALAAQRVPASVPWEIVVVDNKSPDDTKAVTVEFAARSPLPVQYVFERRQGNSHARNAGIAAARGEVLAFTDDDVLPHPDWIAEAAEAIDRWKADGVGGRILPRWEAPPPAWVTGSSRLRGILALMEYPEAKPLSYPILRHPQIRGANMVFRKELFQRIGGFDTELGRIGKKLGTTEDDDLVNRALKAGCVIVYEPRLAVDHRIGADRLRRSYFLRWTLDTAAIHILHEPAPSPPLWLGAPAWQYRQLARLILIWVSALGRRRPDTIERLCDVVEGFGRIRALVKTRHRCRGTRRESPHDPQR